MDMCYTVPRSHIQFPEPPRRFQPVQSGSSVLFIIFFFFVVKSIYYVVLGSVALLVEERAIRTRFGMAQCSELLFITTLFNVKIAPTERGRAVCVTKTTILPGTDELDS